MKFINCLLLLLFPFISIASDQEVTELKQRLSAASSDSAAYKILGGPLETFAKKQQFPEALDLLEKILKEGDFKKPIQNTLLLLKSNLLYKSSNFPDAVATLDAILPDTVAMHPDVLIKTYRLKGQIHFRLKQYVTSEEWFTRAYNAAVKFGYAKIQDDILVNIATCYWENGDLISALKYAQYSIDLCRRNKDLESLSRVLNTQGNIYKELGNYSEANKNYYECIQVGSETGDNEGVVLAMTSIAVILRQQGYPDSSVQQQRTAMQFAQRSGSLHLYSGTCINLATAFMDMKQYDSAAVYLNKALEISEQTNDQAGKATVLSNIGFMHTETGNYQQSVVILKEALQLATALQDIRLMSEISAGLYDNYKAMNQSGPALEYFEKYQIYKDSLLDVQKMEDISQIRAQYLVEQATLKLEAKAALEKEKAEATIKQQRFVKNISVVGSSLLLIVTLFILKLYRDRVRQNKLLSEKNQTIEAALREIKETQSELVRTEKQREALSIRVNIARDIHDEIGSGLTKITLLSDLAIRKRNSDAAPETFRQILSHSKNVSTSLKEIVWAVNPTHDTLSSLVAYMKTTAEQLLEGSGLSYRIYFPDAVDAINIHPEVKRNIYLVMKEALNNALKYSEANSVMVSFSVAAGNFQLTISDNGRGFDAEETKNSGNGLRNMQHRMETIGCSMTITTAPGSGTSIHAEGPLQQS